MKALKIKRRPFTLIEILISLSLVAILLSSLSYIFYQVNISTIAAEKTEKKSFEMRYMENRLLHVVTHAASSENKDFFFFLNHACDGFNLPGSPYLIFTFDNTINVIDSRFSNHVIGRIFIDKENNLSLAISPSPSKVNSQEPVPISREILMGKVKTLEFSFLVSNNQEDNEFALQPGQWVTYWKQEYQSLPSMVRMKISFEENDVLKKRTMIFSLPQAKSIITYRT